MTIMLLWLLATIALASLTVVAARWLGHEVIIAAYVGMLVIAITVAGKLGAIPGFEQYSLSASIFAYSATFIFTDVLSEIWGKQVARKAIYAGVLIYPLLFATTQFSIHWEPHPVWADNQEAFALTMGTTARIVLASLAAFVVSQVHDVWAFHYWKRRTNGKYLWLRNNASTIVSQALDTVVFYTIGFYGVFPIGNLILFTFIVKIIIALIDTPVVYLLVGFLRNNVAAQTTKPVQTEMA